MNALFKNDVSKSNLSAEEILTSQQASEMEDEEAAVYNELDNDGATSGYSTDSSQDE